jgi:cytochrome c55X
MASDIKRWSKSDLLLCLAMGAIAAQAAAQPTPTREQALIRMVRQDCGSCHGMHLTGGLGPALTPVALVDKPLESLVATIYAGRPGTPMPPWKAMLSEAEANWIAQQLLAGFPQESRR